MIVPTRREIVTHRSYFARPSISAVEQARSLGREPSLLCESSSAWPVTQSLQAAAGKNRLRRCPSPDCKGDANSARLGPGCAANADCHVFCDSPSKAACFLEVAGLSSRRWLTSFWKTNKSWAWAWASANSSCSAMLRILVCGDFAIAPSTCPLAILTMSCTSLSSTSAAWRFRYRSMALRQCLLVSWHLLRKCLCRAKCKGSMDTQSSKIVSHSKHYSSCS